MFINAVHPELEQEELNVLCFETFSTEIRSKAIFPWLLCSCFWKTFVSKVAGTQLYDWSLQGYIAVESLWKDNPKKKKSGEKGDKVRSLRNLIFEFTIASSVKKIMNSSGFVPLWLSLYFWREIFHSVFLSCGKTLGLFEVKLSEMLFGSFL